MAGNQQDFILQFDESLKSLQNIDGVLQKTTDNRAQFLGMVTTGLNKIKERIVSLATLITAMKNNLEKLQQQVNNNTSDITTNNREKEQLQQQIARLTAEKTKLEQDLKAREDATLKQMANAQAMIDEKESQILELQNQNKTLTDQTAALNKQLADKGSEGQASAKQLADLTKQNQQALAEQQAAFEQQISVLQKEIQEKDKELLDLTSQLKQARESLASQSDHYRAQLAELQNTIEANTQSTKGLTEQNNILIEKIKQATAIINATVQKLNQLTNDVQNAQDIESITKIFDEVNQEISKIETLLKGTSTPGTTGGPATGIPPDTRRPTARSPSRVERQAPPPPAGTSPGQSSSRRPTSYQSMRQAPDAVTPTTVIITDDAGNAFTLERIQKGLKEKANQSANINTTSENTKYGKALTAINTATTIQQVQDILSANNINIKNNKIMGGNRTKRRHNGGFIYTRKYKSKSRSSSPYTSSRSKSSSSSGKYSRRRGRGRGRGRGRKHSQRK
jgi:hypothetical protein